MSGCGRDGAPPEPPPAPGTTTATGAGAPAPPRPALCAARLRVRVTGRIRAPAATELSGLVLSRTQPGVLWAHNDSGDSPRLLAVARDGRLLAEVAVTGAESFDWEDIAATRGALLVGDIGDNVGQRDAVSVYRVAEPRVGAGAVRRDAAGDALRAALPRRAASMPRRCCATRPTAGSCSSSAASAGARGCTSPTALAAGATTTLRRSGRLELRPGEAVTAGDVVRRRPHDRAAHLRPRPRLAAPARRDRGAGAAAAPVRRARGAAGRGPGRSARAARRRARVLHRHRGCATADSQLRATLTEIRVCLRACRE